MLHYDHPAERIRAIIAELDEPPPPPPPPAPAPAPRPVAVKPPPPPDPWWLVLLRALRPVLVVAFLLLAGFVLYLLSHY